MAAAYHVENRQSSHLEQRLPTGVVPAFKPGPNHRSEATQPNDHSVFPDDYGSSSEDESQIEEFEETIKQGKMELEPSVWDSRDKGTSDHWVHRNPTMIRLTGKHPFNSEPSLNRLMHHGFITPVPLHYVRNHGPVPMATWEDWTVEVTGFVKRPTRFTMAQLVSEFPTREFPVTLVCAGNRRKEQNMVKQTVGFNWGPSAVSTSVWRGVPLRCVLERCGILSRRKGALNVCFEGAEDLPGGGGSKYGTSIKKEFAMDPSRDIVLAYMQNGELLAPDHGFPVRMIIPGFIGGRMVKWLKRIIVTTQESHNYYHYHDNKVLPSHVDSELANAQAWWYKPEYVINELNINSVITSPGHEDILLINSWTIGTPYTLSGYAYSGGGKKVTRVEMTMDGGETWHVCLLDHQEKPTKYGKYWCWCFWSLDVQVFQLLASKEIAVRAWDDTQNTQPEKLIWNLMGMMNNCWFRVKTNVCKVQNGELRMIFEHPTQPGNLSGGWMAREKHIEIPHTNISSSNQNNVEKTTSVANSVPLKTTASNLYSMYEVEKHNSADSAWIIVHGHIYDCTPFLKDHPGGADSILINAGTDCTEEFDAIHSGKAKKLLQDYRTGELITTSSSDSTPPPPPLREIARPRRSVALIPREKIPCQLVEKTSISHDVRKFRFALPSEDQVLGLPVGKHIFLCAKIDGKLCMRGYTPTSTVDQLGYFELVVKIYFKDVNPRFPDGGLMSQYLDSLPTGSVLDVKGPLGHIEYTGKGNFTVHGGRNKFARRLAMIAGGTGITPLYQVIQAILRDPEDETEMYLVYANRTEEDILMREELDSWAAKNPRLKVWYVVGKSLRQGWRYSLGTINESILREQLPGPAEDTVALACGPPSMIQFAVQPNLEKMGYDINNSFFVF